MAGQSSSFSTGQYLVRAQVMRFSDSKGDMTKTVLAMLLIATWCVAAPFAQRQPEPSPQAPPAHNVFVLTGCLKVGADATEAFKLTDASFIGQAPAAGTATAGAVGASGQKAAYELRPATGVDAQGLNADALKAHVGKRLEMIVRPIESPAAAPASGRSGVQATKPSEPAPEPFSVSEIKRVMGTCSE
jgi:hypothetical protein